MESTTPQKHIHILTSEQTRQWYSPLSKVMRERHQSHMVSMCIENAHNSGRILYELYDAHETLVASGSVPGP
jgi:hypothetical protein